MQEERRMDIVAISVLLVIALVLGSYVFVFKNSSSDDHNNEFPPFEIQFPKDEGRHDEVSEVWTIMMNLSTNDGRFFIYQISWSYSNLNGSSSSVMVSFTDPLNTTGTPYFSRTYNIREYNYSTGWLNIKTVDKEGNSFSIRSFDNSTKTYLISISSNGTEDGTPSYNLDAKITSSRAPVLFTQNRNGGLSFGSIYLENGTLFGYMQPDFSVISDFEIAGDEVSASGSAMLFHEWGGVWSSIFELSFLKESQMDSIILRYYYPGGTDIILEQLYLIKKDSYVLYSTFKGNTIGAVIKNNTYTDLSGNTYSLFVTSYTLDPSDPHHHRAYARNISFSDTYLHLNKIIYPYILKQFSFNPHLWIGAVKVLSKSHFSGWGYSMYSKNYQSNPRVVKVQAKSQIPGTLSIQAWVTDSINIKEVFVEYNATEGTKSISMDWNPDCSCWVLAISGLPSGEELQYRIFAVDLADNNATSKWNEFEIS